MAHASTMHASLCYASESAHPSLPGRGTCPLCRIRYVPVNLRMLGGADPSRADPGWRADVRESAIGTTRSFLLAIGAVFFWVPLLAQRLIPLPCGSDKSLALLEWSLSIHCLTGTFTPQHGFSFARSRWFSVIFLSQPHGYLDS